MLDTITRASAVSHGSPDTEYLVRGMRYLQTVGGRKDGSTVEEYSYVTATFESTCSSCETPSVEWQ
jgi:hypothetical protein